MKDALTHEEIDALSGPELSYHVGKAMGADLEMVGEYVLEQGADWTDHENWYLPHVNANLALEVWNRLLTIDKGFSFEMEHGYAGVFHSDWPELQVATGTLCEAICRAFLKAMKGDGG